MTEEQLKELKEWYENDGELHQFQIEKLIDIAERFNKIQKENAILSIMLRDTQVELIDTQQQNKRYRSLINAMKQILKDAIHSLDVGEKVQGLEYGVEMANEALDGETDE